MQLFSADAGNFFLPSKVAQNNSNPLFFPYCLSCPNRRILQNVAYRPTVLYRTGPAVLDLTLNLVLLNMHCVLTTFTNPNINIFLTSHDS